MSYMFCRHICSTPMFIFIHKLYAFVPEMIVNKHIYILEKLQLTFIDLKISVLFSIKKVNDKDFFYSSCIMSIYCGT